MKEKRAASTNGTAAKVFDHRRLIPKKNQPTIRHRWLILHFKKI